MARKTPEWDEYVSITRGDLFLLVTCAQRYESRLPYGIVEGRFLELLTDDMRDDLKENR